MFNVTKIPSADPLIVGRWNKKGKELREFSTMDVKMFIAKICQKK